MKPTEEVLQDLTQPSNISVHSDDALVGKVEAAVAADDKRRMENEDEPLRRKPDLVPIQPAELPRQFAVTLWNVLHNFPDHSVTIVPADTALRAGWALTSRDKGEKLKYRYRPQYFAELWRPGEPSLVIPLACKGNHGDAATSADQLASASAHAEAVHIGAWNETPGLLFSTQLPTDGGTTTVHALQAPGSGGRLSAAEGREPNLNAPPFQANVMPGIHPPTEGLVAPEPVRGCHCARPGCTATSTPSAPCCAPPPSLSRVASRS